MTTEQAIERSVSHNEIVHLSYDEELRAELVIECDDHVKGNDCEEFWGCDAEGNDWRIHMASE